MGLALAAAAGTGSAQGQRFTADEEGLFMIATMVRSCIEVDALLRRTCARIGTNAPPAMRESCQLPVMPFEARTAAAFQTFRQTYRSGLERLDRDIEDTLQRARTSRQRQYGDLIAGKGFSGTDLHMLSAEVRECSKAESLLLNHRPRPR